ncbi:hypothetical protein EH223_11855 [candidate division KSB1 bacterium]|nr:topoisomerase DNA-binding C4 zinc finger domain-containing protein [candidate division KSB1 bacterium]RQW02692.1 MAG: hypothetical protein EH223_11855 [candidate division KSB1 bacterium]
MANSSTSFHFQSKPGTSLARVNDIDSLMYGSGTIDYGGTYSNSPLPSTAQKQTNKSLPTPTHENPLPGTLNGELLERARAVDSTFDIYCRELLNKKRAKRPIFGLAAAIALKKLCEQDTIVWDNSSQSTLSLVFSFKFHDHLFHARLMQVNGKPAAIADKNTAKAIIYDLKQQRFLIDRISNKTISKSPPLPLTTGTLISKAEKYIGLSARQTMDTARSLSCNCHIGLVNPVGLITSPVTDSLFIPEKDILSIREYILINYNKTYLPEKPRLHAEKIDLALSAIRPVLISRTPKKIKKHLTDVQHRLYDLIWRRSIASQMTETSYHFRKIVISAGPEKRYIFHIEQKQTADRGYLQLFPQAENKNSCLFSHEFRKNGELVPHEFEIILQDDRPDFYYTEGRLLEAVADADVCLNETLEFIPDILREWKFIRTTDDGKIFPTRLGRDAYVLLQRRYPDIMNEHFVRQQKKQLVQKTGKQPRTGHPAAELHKLLQHQGRPAQASDLAVTQKTRQKCPVCGGTMLKKQSDTGEFLVCEHFPESCQYSKVIPTHIHRYYGRCEKCDAELTVKIGRYGRFLACSRFPKCTFTKPYPTGAKCPCEGCDGEVIERITKTGRLFYGCSHFPKCQFSSWQMPVNIACPKCSNMYLVAKAGENLDILKCPKCRTEFDHNLKKID